MYSKGTNFQIFAGIKIRGLDTQNLYFASINFGRYNKCKNFTAIIFRGCFL